VKSQALLSGLVSLGIAVPLLLAGGSKLMSPAPLAAALGKVYRWAGSRPNLTMLIVWVVAVTELSAAFLVLTGWLRPAGFALTGAVGIGIAAFAASALLLRRHVSCGCFGEAGGRPLGAGNVLAGLALVAGAFVARQASPLQSAAVVLLLLASTAALAWVLFKHRTSLSGPFGRHFRSFSRVGEGTNTNG
jgi:hypothetical protein